MTLAEKAAAAGLDKWTIDAAQKPFLENYQHEWSVILEAHHRMCIYALCHDNPVGNVHFPLFAAGVVRECQ
jgi:hypothetical protein